MQTADFYSSATGTLRVNGGRDENAPQGVSLSIDDLSYIKQGSRANENSDSFTPTQAQLDAMNSGITSEGVEQITTNKNNISWLANYGGYKNIIKVTKASIKAANPNLNWHGYTAVNHGGLTFAINDDLSITINGTTTAGGIEFLLKSRTDGLPLFPVVGDYRIDGKIISGKGSLVVNRTIGGSGVRYGADTGDTDTFTVNQDDLSRPVGIWFGINEVGVSFDDVTIYPMICLASMDRIYQPYCPSNYDLYQMILAL